MQLGLDPTLRLTDMQMHIVGSITMFQGVIGLFLYLFLFAFFAKGLTLRPNYKNILCWCFAVNYFSFLVGRLLVVASGYSGIIGPNISSLDDWFFVLSPVNMIISDVSNMGLAIMYVWLTRKQPHTAGRK